MASSLMQRWLGQGAPVKETYSRAEKLVGLFDLTRPRLAVMTPLNAGSAAVLALGGFPSLPICLAGSAAVALSVGGIHCVNDFVDRRRDLVAWPGRPIPGGRVRASWALLLALACFASALGISWAFFNTVNLLIFAAALALGCFYSAYLRDRVGYLSLPPINGMIYLGGWAAVSPDTLLSSALPWLLYALGFCWQAAHIMLYSPVHPIRKAGARWRTEVPALFFVPTPRGAAAIGLGFFLVTLALAVTLSFVAQLGIVYLALLVIISVPTLLTSIAFLRDWASREKGIKAFSAMSNFRLVLSVAILLDVLLVALQRG